jgi:hypothetical protein
LIGKKWGSPEEISVEMCQNVSNSLLFGSEMRTPERTEQDEIADSPIQLQDTRQQLESNSG